MSENDDVRKPQAEFLWYYGRPDRRGHFNGLAAYLEFERERKIPGPPLFGVAIRQ